MNKNNFYKCECFLYGDIWINRYIIEFVSYVFFILWIKGSGEKDN